MSLLRIIYLFVLLSVVSSTACPQQPVRILPVNDTTRVEPVMLADSIRKVDVPAIDTLITGTVLQKQTETYKVIGAENDTIQAVFKKNPEKVILTRKDSLAMERLMKEPFSPSPRKAVIYAAIFPGLGQIYNRAYWKLPLLYGGLMGTFYAVTWNNKMLQDYTQAHRDLLNDRKKHPNNPGEWKESWQYYATGQVEDKFNSTQFSDFLKNSKDFYRRYRDLSIFFAIGVYALGIIDAYVDAELFNFDISPDLSMRVEPVVAPGTKISPRTYGLSCNLTF